ncbi:hypothetical protein [Actinomadura sp. 3N508]
MTPPLQARIVAILVAAILASAWELAGSAGGQLPQLREPVRIPDLRHH